MAEHESSIEIAADPETVFDYLVTEDGMTAWMGRSAHLEPHVGGAFAVEIAGYGVRGEYLVVDRPRRVASRIPREPERRRPPMSARETVLAFDRLSFAPPEEP